MGQQLPPAAVLRDFGQWLQRWADFALAQADWVETEGAPAGVAQSTSADDEATINSDTAPDLAGPESPPETSLPAAPGDSPPDHWLALASSPAPPAHWLALFEEGDPELLSVETDADPADGDPPTIDADDTHVPSPTAEAPATKDPEAARPLDDQQLAAPLAQWLRQIQAGASAFLDLVEPEGDLKVEPPDQPSTVDLRDEPAAAQTSPPVSAEAPAMLAAASDEPVAQDQPDQPSPGTLMPSSPSPDEAGREYPPEGPASAAIDPVSPPETPVSTSKVIQAKRTTSLELPAAEKTASPAPVGPTPEAVPGPPQLTPPARPRPEAVPGPTELTPPAKPRPEAVPDPPEPAFTHPAESASGPVDPASPLKKPASSSRVIQAKLATSAELPPARQAPLSEAVRPASAAAPLPVEAAPPAKPVEPRLNRSPQSPQAKRVTRLRLRSPGPPLPEIKPAPKPVPTPPVSVSPSKSTDRGPDLAVMLDHPGPVKVSTPAVADKNVSRETTKPARQKGKTPEVAVGPARRELAQDPKPEPQPGLPAPRLVYVPPPDYKPALAKAPEPPRHRWPDLPERPPPIKNPGHKTRHDPARRRRLDQEQRGKPWNA